jgi:hypothetical protein
MLGGGNYGKLPSCHSKPQTKAGACQTLTKDKDMPDMLLHCPRLMFSGLIFAQLFGKGLDFIRQNLVKLQLVLNQKLESQAD